MQKIKEILPKAKTIIIVLLSIFVTFSMNMSWDKNTAIRYSFTGNSILWVMFFVLTYWLLNKISDTKNRRLKICCIILAILFATFEVVGNSIDTYLDLSGVLESKITIMKSIIKWIGYLTIIYGILVNIFIKLENKEFIKGKSKWFTDNKRTFFWVWGLIFVAWIPYFLNYYPGVITPDSMGQIGQGLGISNLTNHHPAFHTFFISIAMNIGKLLGNYNLGVAIYSVVQMIVTSGIFSFTIYYMAKRGVDSRFRILTLLFYAFYPVNALYSITMWKDIPFAIAMLVFTIMMTELGINQEHFMKSKRKNALLVISMLLVILFRNNGFYVILLTIPCLFIFARKHYKKLIVVSCIVLATYMIWKGPVFSLFNIKPGSSREALSIPLQQFARVTKNHSDTLTDDEKWRIYKYLPTDNLAEVYTPKISDPVKNNFNNEGFAEDKIGLVKLYIKLAIKYPRATVESFLCNNFGYWYPEAIHWVVGREVYQSTLEKEKALDLKNAPIVELRGLEEFDTMLDRRDLPLNSMLYSIGFAFWVVLTMFMYAIYKKKYNLILIYIPIVILWLTTNASPVFGEYRYIYSMFTCLPILMGIHFIEKRKKKIEKRKINGQNQSS